jgi:hypothetical protein
MNSSNGNEANRRVVVFTQLGQLMKTIHICDSNDPGPAAARGDPLAG